MPRRIVVRASAIRFGTLKLAASVLQNRTESIGIQQTDWQRCIYFLHQHVGL